MWLAAAAAAAVIDREKASKPLSLRQQDQVCSPGLPLPQKLSGEKREPWVYQGLAYLLTEV